MISAVMKRFTFAYVIQKTFQVLFLSFMISIAPLFTTRANAEKSCRELSNIDIKALAKEHTGATFKLQELVWQLERKGEIEKSRAVVEYIKKALSERPILTLVKEGKGLSGEDPAKEKVDLGGGVYAVFKWDSQDKADVNPKELIDKTPFLEMASYELSEMLGVSFVPVTILRTYNSRLGSIQIFAHNEQCWPCLWDFKPELHSVEMTDEELLARRVFQFITDNSDPDALTVALDVRKSGKNNNYEAWIDNESSFGIAQVHQLHERIEDDKKYRESKSSRYDFESVPRSGQMQFVKNFKKLDLNELSRRMRKYLKPR